MTISKINVLFSIVLTTLSTTFLSAQTIQSPTWFTPLEDEAVRAREIADSLGVMTPNNQPLPDWAGYVHGSGKDGVIRMDSELFSGLNVDGEYRLIQGDNPGSATIIGLRAFGDLRERFHYEVSAERWKLPVTQSQYDEGLKWGYFDGIGRVTGDNPGSNYARALQVDRLTFRLSAKISESIELAVGHGQHHWGPGIRSLYIDRSMAPASYVRLYGDVGVLHYTHLLVRTIHPRETNDTIDIGWMASHMVDVHLGAGFTGSLFGGVKWRDQQDGINHRIEPAYLIPLVAFRPTEFSLGSPDNVLMGAQLVWRGKGRSSGHKKTFYTQILFDELKIDNLMEGGWWANKWGVLSGGSLASRSGKWRVSLEGSAVRPFTYSHGNEIQSWTHAHKPIGPPLGSNFVDLILRVRWKLMEDYLVRLSFERVYRGLDSENGFSTGSDVFRNYQERDIENEFDNVFFQGVESEMQRISIDIARPAGEKFNISGIELFARASMRVESHFMDVGEEDAEIEAWSAFRIQAGIRSSRVLEGRDW